MQNFITFTAVLACAAAAPGLYLTHDSHLIPVSKSTLTKSSQVVNHGSTYIHHPVLPVVHTPLTAKTTITKSSQLVNHGGTEVVHVPIVHHPHVIHETAHLVHEPVHLSHEPTHFVHSSAKSSQYFNLESVPVKKVAVTHLVHAPVVHSAPVYVHSPVVAVKTGDSAVSHHSSTVHETVPVVKSLPLVAFHH